MKKEISDIYKDLREGFLVVGLTGAVGSGCTQAARILSSSKDEIEVVLRQVATDNGHECLSDSLEERRIHRIRNFYDTSKWQEFYHLKVSNLICAMIFSDENYQDYFEALNLDKWVKQQSGARESLISASKNVLSRIYDNSGVTGIKDGLSELDIAIDKYINKKDPAYVATFQEAGDCLRRTGKINPNASRQATTSYVFTVSELIRRTIKILHKFDLIKFFAIDALRNSFEIQFFKNRYSNFYLFSVSAGEGIRRSRAKDNFGYSDSDFNNLMRREKADKESTDQNINSCIGLGDVFLDNNTNDLVKLKYQLYKYVALLRKPGLFTPTSDERNMQIALTARYNSGCISRQVGACVVGSSGYVLGVGWNDVQEGNTPCLYRSPADLIASSDSNGAYSEYERSAEFKGHLESRGKSNQVEPFCFKDERNKIEASSSLKGKLSEAYLSVLQSDEAQYKNLIGIFKNPTRERALHAEENAFLQAAKVGGASIQGGTLYTTASPCQLCAKKSMQLRIKRVVYIDAYPDISQQQTLQSGDSSSWPKLDMFVGVGENAFMKLFKPIVPIKDEISSRCET